MGSPARKLTWSRLLFIALVTGCVVFWYHPLLLEIARSRLGLIPVDPLGGLRESVPREHRGPPQQARGEPGPLKPASGTDAAAVYPALYPRGVGLDGFVWRVFQDQIALGAARLAAIRCLDPAVVEAALPAAQPLPANGSLPDPGELARLRGLLGASRWLLPTVETADGHRVRARLLLVEGTDARAGSRTLGTAEWDASDSAGAALALWQLGREGLLALGAKRPVQAPGADELRLVPPEPLALLENLLSHGALPDGNPALPSAWPTPATESTRLGYLLTSGHAAQGPRLLVRGAALGELARLTDVESSSVDLSRALASLAARHTSISMKLLEPWLARDLPRARWLAEACRSAPDKLPRVPGSEFVHWLAVDRAMDPPSMGPMVADLRARGVPLAFLVAGTARWLGVGLGRQYSTEWLTSACPPAGAAQGAASFLAMLTGPNGSLAAMVTEAGRRLASEHGQFPRSQACEAAVARPRKLDELELRSELVALPASEYYCIARWRWGVDQEADAMRQAVEKSLPRASAFKSALENEARQSPGPAWVKMVEDWLQEEPLNPFAQQADFDAHLCHGARKVSDLHTGWELGNAVDMLVYQRFANHPPLLLGLDGALDALRFELDVDPWSPSVWTDLLSVIGHAAPSWAELEPELARARERLPDSQTVAVAEAKLHRAWLSPMAEAACYRRSAERFPSDCHAVQQLCRLQIEGRDFAAAEQTLTELARRTPREDDLLVAAQLNALANEYMTVGQLDKAARLVRQSAEIDEWKADTTQVLGRLSILQGKVPEGLASFARGDERYRSVRGGYLAVRALLEAKNTQQALAHAAELEGRATEQNSLLRDLGRTFLWAGDSETGLAYLRKAQERHPSSLLERDHLMLQTPELAGHPMTCRRVETLSAWLAACKWRLEWEWLVNLRSNPYPEAIDAMLEHSADPGVGRSYALQVATVAGLNLGLPPTASPEECRRAQEKLAAWWQGARPGYLERQFGGVTKPK